LWRSGFWEYSAGKALYGMILGRRSPGADPASAALPGAKGRNDFHVNSASFRAAGWAALSQSKQSGLPEGRPFGQIASGDR
jgi:hypothetical protein